MDDDEIPDLIDVHENGDSSSPRIKVDQPLRKVPITIVTGRDSSLSSISPFKALTNRDRLPRRRQDNVAQLHFDGRTWEEDCGPFKW